MANKDVVIRISATDAASPTFRKIAGDARAMGATVEQAATTGERGMDRINKGAVAMGAAIGGATMLLGEWSRAAAQDEANQARLQQAVENTGKAYDEYSDAIDKAIKKGQEKAFSDDDTREALVRLNAVTNDTGQSLDQLSLVMDFARARGISLADSAGIIAKVMGGNVSILQRYGLAVEDGATATEALALVQQRSMGQASAYADSQIGQLDKMKDKWGELTETIGGSTGELQQFLLLMPGLSAGATALAGLVGGVGGLGAAASALARYSGPLALIAGGGALAYGYTQDTLGTTQINSLANQFFMTMSQVLNELLPGNPYDPTKYTDQMNANAQWDQINSAFAGQGLSQDTIVRAVARMVGVQGTFTNTGTQQVFDQYGNPSMQMVTEYNPPSADQVLSAVVAAATAGNMDIATYILSLASKSPATATTSLVASAMVPKTPYAGPYQPNGGFTQYSPPQYYGDINTTKPVTGPAIGGAASKDMSGYRTGPADSATYSADIEAQRQAALTAALEEQLGAWSALAGGITSTADAQSALSMVQNIVIDQQQVYSGQISEYSQQENALTAARDVLLERQAEGVALTEDEQALLENYPALYERVSGGVDDATVSAGLLAAQYIENMKLGDEINQNMNEQTGAVGDLVSVIEEMILSMSNVPDEVKTQILLENADESIEDLIRYLSFLNSIPGYVQTVVDTTFVESGDGSGGRFRAAADGTTMNAYAGGGTVYGGNHALVGERGPEVVWLPNGAQVMNTEGSKSRMQSGRRGRGDFVNQGTINFQMNTPDVYGAVEAYALGGAR